MSRLYRPRPALAPLLLVIAAGLIAMVAVVWTHPGAARRGRTAVAEAPAAGAAALGAAAGRARLTAAAPDLAMFDYRYHALSLAAVLFALALGVADRRRDRRLEPRLLGQERDRPQPQLRSQRRPQPGWPRCRRRSSTSEEAFANGLYPLAVHDLLAGHDASGCCSSAAPPNASTRSCATP